MRFLAVNAGSTSFKLERYDLERDALPPIADPPLAVDERAVPLADAAAALASLRGSVDVAAHRFVRLPDDVPPIVRLDDDVIAAIRAVAGDAPLHSGPALAAVEALVPLGVPQFAVSDSGFHATMPPAATTYALPQALTAQGYRRRGYHGINHEYAVHRAARLAGREMHGLRCVTLHLGGGSSLCATRDGASVDTTMGYTPLEGIPMATRSGTVDPGLLLHLLRGGTSVDDLETMLNERSGLLGISGRSGDVRDLLAAGDDPHARLALDVFAWRTRAALGAMIAVLGGVDCIAFTGGIGEHAATLRAAILEGAAAWGGALDSARNESARADALISPPGARIAVAVVEAREGWQLVRAAAHACSLAAARIP